MQNLDVSHLKCPLALLQVKRWLLNCAGVSQVELIAPTGADSQDILRFIHLSGHQVVTQQKESNSLKLVINMNPRKDR